MEDYGSILWLLAIVGAMIYSASSKARKKAQEAAKKAIREMQEKAHRQEAWPSWDVATESAKTFDPAEDTEAVSLESLDPEIPTNAYGNYAPSAVVMQSAFEPELPAKNEEGILRTDAASMKSKKIVASNADADSIKNSANGIVERFDLRSAVIFSEILKPKYTEYE